MNQIIFVKFITREFVQSNPDMIFIFGDNEQRKGLGGQAKEMRGEPNCIGIRTKKNPSNNKEDYYTDLEYPKNLIFILADFIKVEQELKKGKTIVIPQDGIGTGLANLKRNAPMTLQFIENYIKWFVLKYNKE